MIKKIRIFLLFCLFLAVHSAYSAETVTLPDGTKFEFVQIEPGGFEMGNYLSSQETAAKFRGLTEAYQPEHPRHHVEIGRFNIGKYEVTQRQWLAVMGYLGNPSRHTGNLELPVENISYASIEVFLDKFNFLVSTGSFRLPTEAEWEYACSEGKNGAFQYPWGSDELDPAYCWYYKNSSHETHLVGTKKPNAFGLYDMLGNVREWCRDYYDPFFYNHCWNLNLTDNPWNSVECKAWVLRGGSFQSREDTCRPCFRDQFNQHNRSDNAGFRLACDPGEPVPGREWVQPGASAPPRKGHSSVVFQDKILLIAGADNGVYQNDVWSCSDTTEWSQITNEATFGKRYCHTSVFFDNRIWVIGGWHGSVGAHSDVWYSGDGIRWFTATQAAEFGPRFFHSSVVFHGRIWIIGGCRSLSTNFLNDVWYSGDGASWVQATASAGFSPRYGHTSVVFDDKIWVIGGGNSSLYKNDVWYSSDGVNWVQAAAAASFSPRYGHSSIVFDDKIWIIGGSSTSYLKDIWYSINGISWYQAVSTKEHGGFWGSSSVIYHDKIWLIGGWDGTNCTGDVWHSP